MSLSKVISLLVNIRSPIEPERKHLFILFFIFAYNKLNSVPRNNKMKIMHIINTYTSTNSIHRIFFFIQEKWLVNYYYYHQSNWNWILSHQMTYAINKMSANNIWYVQKKNAKRKIPMPIYSISSNDMKRQFFFWFSPIFSSFTLTDARFYFCFAYLHDRLFYFNFFYTLSVSGWCRFFSSMFCVSKYHYIHTLKFFFYSSYFIIICLTFQTIRSLLRNNFSLFFLLLLFFNLADTAINLVFNFHFAFFFIFKTHIDVNCKLHFIF